jgi:molybdopterin-guanine dinucleotide biosynthesis adapter protein
MKTFGFAGWSGSGKTTLIERLIPLFVEHGLKVSLIKHAHHDFDVDKPGKDSWRHRKAGCTEVLLVSDQRMAIMHELHGAPEPDLDQCIARLAPCDLLLVEGFKFHPIPKLEIWRAEVGKPLLHPEDSHIVAIASDTPVDTRLPRFDINDAHAIAEFIVKHLEPR